MKVRLQKFLAEAGLGSRRGCEDLIRAGRVTVDGRVAALGDSVDPATATVLLDGRPVAREGKEYWLLNKPAGVLSAAVDTRGRRTVTDCVPARGRVFPVGRLDLNSTGLLVLTNDGELAARLLHPRYHVEKEYLVTVRGTVAEAALGRLRHGLTLEDGPTAPAQVEIVSSDRAGALGRNAAAAKSAPRTSAPSARGAARGAPSARSAPAPGAAAAVKSPATRGPTTTLRVVIHEGRKRQVRRMMEAVGHRVVALHRTRFDGLTDAGLALGQARPLSPGEVERLRRAAFGE